MFFRKRGKKSKAHPNAAAVNWIIIGFVAFAVLTNLSGNKEPVLQPAADKFKTSVTNAIPRSTVDFSTFKAMILPDFAAKLQVKDNEPGEGPPAVCGQDATVAYTAFRNDDTPIDDSASKDKPLIVHIGEQQVIPAIELGVIDMKAGGKRTIISPGSTAYDVPGYQRKDVPEHMQVRFEVELLALTPKLPQLDDLLYRIVTVQKGMGRELLCGDKAKAFVTIWNIEGKKLFSNEGETPLVFAIGKSETFIGLEQGVIGMNIGGSRTLIVPPVFLKTMNGNPMKTQIPLPEKQTVLVDVRAMP